jgi:phosphoribosylaminoimidazolecarboxamide formyltransferase/IMP cyclohydrolase
MNKKISSALISVFYKDNLAPIVKLLHQQGVKLYSTGGTQSFIEGLGIPVTAVENLTSYPSIFGGRVKTLHPKIFGGILYRRENSQDIAQAKEFDIPSLDLVIVDLYPFEETVASGASESDVIEKIDIGGISLIRAAAKNFQDVLIVASREQYTDLEQLLREKGGVTDLENRRWFAAQAFDVTSHYDTHIFNYFNHSLPSEKHILHYKESIKEAKVLRYGENPHQGGIFFGKLEEMLEQLHGKELSYNNLVDIDAAVNLAADFPKNEGIFYGILKHTNACGAALRNTPVEAYLNALKCDPVSAFGGVIITNAEVDLAAAEELNKLFFEVLIAPSYNEKALEVLKSKKNRILLLQKNNELPQYLYKTLLNGVIGMERDAKVETPSDLKVVTKVAPTQQEIASLLFANKLVKHSKSNAIILAKDGQLFASGIGQTSRVDSLRQAIHKAKSFGFDLNEAVMASEAFFPFPDCVEIAHGEGIKAVIQPGGSVKDQDSVKFCDEHGMSMVFTGFRHFKH